MEVQKNFSNEAVVIDHVVNFLNNNDVSSLMEITEADSAEKQIALEFVKSYVQFLRELVEYDFKKNLIRSDVEIRDLISHVNIMMKKRYEEAFMAMVLQSVSHYRNMQARILAEEQQEKSTTEKDKK